MPARSDQAFQIIHADGTEMMVSNGLPPSLGNVCVGIWKQIAPRTFKLKHMTWNWDGQGGLAGTFLMTVTITLDGRGRRFAGTWAADSYDTNGQLIPELHADGSGCGARRRERSSSKTAHATSPGHYSQRIRASPWNGRRET